MIPQNIKRKAYLMNINDYAFLSNLQSKLIIDYASTPTNNKTATKKKTMLKELIEIEMYLKKQEKLRNGN